MAGTIKWRPKRWRIEYDRIVAYSALGKSNQEIAEIMGFNKVHISSILNQPQALELMEKLRAKLVENVTANVPDVLTRIAIKATQRLETFMNDDDLYQKSPFAFIDRSLDVLKGSGKLNGGGVIAPAGSTFNTQINITQSQKSDILQGLERVAEVKKLHTGTDG